MLKLLNVQLYIIAPMIQCDCMLEMGEVERNVCNDRSPVASTGSLLQWSQWQLIDSILPTGGFAHSLGLEAAAQARLVSQSEDLRMYVIHVLENTGSLLLPFVYSATISPDIQTWHKLDNILNATLTNEVSRKASISQGSALIRVSASVFSEAPSLKTMRDVFLSSGAVFFHHAPIFGLICGLLGLDSETSQRAYMFITMRDIISAATRLNLVGPLGGAVLQHQVTVVTEDLLKRWMNRLRKHVKQVLCLILYRVVMATCSLDFSALEG